MTWVEQQSKNNETYYYNTDTGESRWNKQTVDCLSTTKTMYSNTAKFKSQRSRDNMLIARNIHNYIKNSLISTYCFPRTSVLDLCCGKGGDLFKFKSRYISDYVGVDFSKESIKIANIRVKSIESSFNYKFVPFNLAKDVLDLQKQFDLVNAQFCLHYFFSSRAVAELFMDSVSNH